MGELRLEVREFESMARWRWLLTGLDGGLLADHEVRLDAGCWQFEAFTDLLGYLRWHAAPDQRIEDEARIVAEVGEWTGEQVFGAVGVAMLRARPATVRVVVPAEPEEARSLVFRPLELAHVAGRPLAVQGVTLVMQPDGDDTPRDVAPVGDKLRVLGLFSLPAGGHALNLRRERQALVRLLSGIAAVDRAVEVRVLQYGVTRERLREVFEEGEGWDVIHISGHGAPGELLLETEDGSPDPMTAGELANLLDLARERLKLVSVSACWSAALTAAEQRRLLGLPTVGSARQGRQAAPGQGEAASADGPGGVPDQGGSRDPADVPGQADGPAAGALATELAGRLGCAVLAMRYPVVDDFAIALAGKLYELLAARNQPLPRAIGMALSEVVALPPTPACPALSVATPALFGARAIGLRLAAPKRSGPESYDAAALKMAGFPPQPDRFVGRTAVMARASAVLAGRSTLPGVLMYGMPGAGKTACALELAYTHEHAFDRLVWFKAPDEGRDITGALTEFALTLERRLPGFKMLHVLENSGRLDGFLPELTELFERRRALIVVDNIESLLTERGQWRDARWGQVVAALCGHTGLGRVVLTSRRTPDGLDRRVQAEAVDALSLDEALLLAREMPHLDALIGGALPGIDPAVARGLAVGVLEAAQGHPMLLELADGQAADPGRLRKLVEAADAAWRKAGGLPHGFFTVGETRAAGEDYLHVLAAWTRVAAAGLRPVDRDLLGLLCCLEEVDRIRLVVEGSWPYLWRRLGRSGEPPALDEGLAALAVRGLVAVQPGSSQDAQSYRIHPGVAAAGRDLAGTEFQEAVDSDLAEFWATMAVHAREQEAQDQTGEWAVRAGLAATPYLLRQGRWEAAAGALSITLTRDRSRATAGAALPALKTIAAGVAGTEYEHTAAIVLARALEVIAPAAAEQQMRSVLAAALARQDYNIASVAAMDLARYCRLAGRLSEALTLAENHIEYRRRAGHGPWSQLSAEGVRLRVLAEMGQSAEILAEVSRLWRRMETLPDTADLSEGVEAWNVREALLGTALWAAVSLSRWEDALRINAAAIASKVRRGAPHSNIARSRFNDYGPLIRLGRVEEALAMLVECREIFEQARDLEMLAKVFNALAHVEDERGHSAVAIGLARAGLRYSYLASPVGDIAQVHHNLGTSLWHAGKSAEAVVHHLAAALIRAMSGGAGLGDSVSSTAADLRVSGDTAVVPAGVVELCRRVAEVPGVNLDRLLAGLAPDPRAVHPTLEVLITRIRALAGATRASPSPYLASWDPVIAALLAVQVDATPAAAALDNELARAEETVDWAALVRVLRRLCAGETGPDLLAGLDEIDTAIASRALDALAGWATVPAALSHAIPLGSLLSDMVAAALGDAAGAQRTRQVLNSLAEDPVSAAVAGALARILGGDRDPSLASGLDPTDSAIVATVLYHIGTHEPEAK